MSLQQSGAGVLLSRMTHFLLMVSLLTPYLTTSNKFQRKNKTHTMYFPWTSSWLLITTNKTIILSVIWKEKRIVNSSSTFCSCNFCTIWQNRRPQVNPACFTQMLLLWFKTPLASSLANWKLLAVASQICYGRVEVCLPVGMTGL